MLVVLQLDGLTKQTLIGGDPNPITHTYKAIFYLPVMQVMP